MNLTNPSARIVFLRRTYAIYRNQKHRAHLVRQTLPYHLAQFRAQVESAEQCPYCRTLLLPENFSADHNLPVSRVSDPITWSIGNIVISCERCNQYKGNMSAEEFLRLLAVIKTFHPAAAQNLLARLRAGAPKAAGRRR